MTSSKFSWAAVFSSTKWEWSCPVVLWLVQHVCLELRTKSDWTKGQPMSYFRVSLLVTWQVCQLRGYSSEKTELSVIFWGRQRLVRLYCHYFMLLKLRLPAACCFPGFGSCSEATLHLSSNSASMLWANLLALVSVELGAQRSDTHIYDSGYQEAGGGWVELLAL